MAAKSKQADGYIRVSPRGEGKPFISPDVQRKDRRHAADDIGRFGLGPDGRKIVVTVGRIRDVFVVNSDGDGLREVGVAGDRPSWSPDGRWVVYAGYRNSQGDIYIGKPHGSDERQLTNAALDEAGLVWSPVG